MSLKINCDSFKDTFIEEEIDHYVGEIVADGHTENEAKQIAFDLLRGESAQYYGVQDYLVSGFYCMSCGQTHHFDMRLNTTINVTCEDGGFNVSPDINIEKAFDVREMMDYVSQSADLVICKKCGSNSVYRYMDSYVVEDPEGIEYGGVVDLDDEECVKEYLEMTEGYGQDAIDNHHYVKNSIKFSEGYVKNRCIYCISSRVHWFFNKDSCMSLNEYWGGEKEDRTKPKTFEEYWDRFGSNMCDRLQVHGLKCYSCPLITMMEESKRMQIHKFVYDRMDIAGNICSYGYEDEVGIREYQKLWEQLL